MAVQNIIHKRINDLVAPAFNAVFGTKLKFTDFEFVNVAPNTDQGAVRDTKGTIRIVDSSPSYTGQREVKYNRVDAMSLWYGIPKFIELAENQLNPTSVVAYLSKRYGLDLEVDHIDAVTIGQGYVEITFANRSPIIKNAVRFSYYLSSIDLSVLVADPNLGLLTIPELYSTVNASYYSYPLDLTFVKYDIEDLAVNDPAPLALADTLTAVTGDPWVVAAQSGNFNLGEARLVFAGTSVAADAEGYPANVAFPNCAIFRLSNLCTNLSGLLLVNMY